MNVILLEESGGFQDSIEYGVICSEVHGRSHESCADLGVSS